MKACALYARISTHDGRQSVLNQLAAMRDYCDRRQWHIAAEFVDQFSGSAPARERDQLLKLLNEARAGRFDTVLVFAMDRLTREGVLQSFEYVKRLTDAGVEFLSITEPQFQTAGPAGELFMAVAAWMAKQEREQIRARVRAGLARAKSQGVRLGRPRASADLLKMKLLYVDGKSLRDIATEMNLSRSTVERLSKDWRQKRRQEVTA